MSIIEFIKQPWPWYVAGPLIGLTVPALLIIGNKSFGISSSLRHICAACLPANIPFFKYDWKKRNMESLFCAGHFCWRCYCRKSFGKSVTGSNQCQTCRRPRRLWDNRLFGPDAEAII